MTVRVYERLVLLDGERQETTRHPDDPPRFEATPYGVVRIDDSITGKRRADRTLYPWRRVESLAEWRSR